MGLDRSGSPSRLQAEQVPEAVAVEIQPVQSGKREDQTALPVGDRTDEPAGSGRVLLKKGDRVDFDVGFLVDLVRVPMMARVLRIPPRAAHADGATASVNHTSA